MRRTDSFLAPSEVRTSRLVRWAGLAVGFVALAVAGRIAIASLAESESPAGHLARTLDAKLPPERDPAPAPWSAGVITASTVGSLTAMTPAGATPSSTLPPGELSVEAPRSREPAKPDPPAAARPTPPGPRIAVVFDDLGYSVTGLARELLEMPPPLTFAVLGNLSHSAAFAESARAHGHEVLLHVPMEPLDPISHNPGPGALMVDLEPAENLNRLRAQLDSFDGYVGISNHMGSRFATERRYVGPVLREIRRLRPDCYLLDSKTTPYSILALEARQIGLPCVENNTFLDGDAAHPDAPARQLGVMARQRGSAVGIGHVRRETIDGFRIARARWEQEGIRLVALSELVTRDSLP